jgi:hypothetical protein
MAVGYATGRHGRGRERFSLGAEKALTLTRHVHQAEDRLGGCSVWACVASMGSRDTMRRAHRSQDWRRTLLSE